MGQQEIRKRIEELKSLKSDPKLCEDTAIVYARVSGYMRDVSNFNIGKSQEFKDRKMYSTQKI